LLLGLLIPLIRYRIFKREFFNGGKRRELYPRVVPALLLGLLMDALGQMAGYALGPGNAPAVLAVFEMDRMQHLIASDRRQLTPPDLDPRTPA